MPEANEAGVRMHLNSSHNGWKSDNRNGKSWMVKILPLTVESQSLIISAVCLRGEV